MARYLLQQWTADTIALEERSDVSGHGVELWAAPSSSGRLLELEPDDVVFVAAVTNGRVLPICRVVVDRVATYDELVAEGHDPYDLPFQALARTPLPRMNLRRLGDDDLSLSLRKEDGETLARRRRDPRQLDGQSFRTPQWIDAQSASLLSGFLDDLWTAEDDTGLNDPGRISRGLAPRLSPAEREAVERRAMDVVEEHYRGLGYDVDDVSASGAWDFTASHPDGDVVHIEVKGTTGRGDAVTVTAGERRHAEEFGHPALAIVTRICLARGGKPAAQGGVLAFHLDPWSTEDGSWTATVWRYEPPS
jgi:hypothetical protein